MSIPVNSLDDAVEVAKKAVKFDEEGETNIAAYYYEAAASLLEQLAPVSDSEKAEPMMASAKQYKLRANDLRMKTPNEGRIKGDMNNMMAKRCYFLLQQAIEEDEHGDKQDAIELYAKAVEYITQFPDLIQGDLKSLTLQALDRAEDLKGIKKHQPTRSSQPLHSSTANSSLHEKSTSSAKPVPKPKQAFHRASNVNLQGAGNDTYSDEEKEVLLFTSHINKRDYVPFMSIDLLEKFQYSMPFSDQAGFLTLAPKQKRDFYKFVRPEELCSDPCIVFGSVPNYLNIKQTVISDCSFVASLAVSASYEKSFGKKLVTAIIFPQSKDKQPLYNPFGKYMVKLHINGIARKVIIDDSLPIDKFGRLLCSYSSNKNEFWISLLEKAYMKVMGGYDFPGSNSVYPYLMSCNNNLNE
ncbi:unnamed protein product [Phaedon cochleariae]|uniref:Calpain catalytic domain-containing protein n=1 Tax=Phaedon cochleariae TaxID=80249 RepID=A0A9N9SAT5_PHACE|nr:unnamed protein product [Phaedon cochleariae]